MTLQTDESSLVVKLKMGTQTEGDTPGSTSSKPESKEVKPFPTLYDTIVYVDVGPTQERFGIHQALLPHQSPYFKAALTGGFRESQTGVINLEDEDLEVFQRFNEWLYSGTLPYEHYATHRERWSALLGLYVFAENRVIPKFQNAVIDAMIKLAADHGYVPHTEIYLAWINTATSSPLHTFLVDLYVRTVPMTRCFGQDSGQRGCYDVDFVMQVAIALDSLVGDPEGYRHGTEGLWKDRCLWHIHGPEDPPCTGDATSTDSG